MGIILASNRTYLKKYSGHKILSYLNKFMTRASISIMTKRTLDKWLIYSSNLPILVLGYLEFILDLVYFPVNITTPIIQPAASTVLAQAVLSRFKDYFFPYPVLKLPIKS